MVIIEYLIAVNLILFTIKKKKMKKINLPTTWIGFNNK